jgi:hypothetical protein
LLCRAVERLLSVVPYFHGSLPIFGWSFHSFAARQDLATTLLNTKLSDIRIEHELFARDQRNVQKISVSLDALPRDALNKGMTFEQRGPNGRELISFAHQLGALAREVAGSLPRHFHPLDSILIIRPDNRRRGGA